MAQILATVKVISDLRAYTSFSPGMASNPATGDDVTIIVQGYNTPGDGGGGTFVWKRYSDMFYGNPTYVPSTPYEDGGIFIDSNDTFTFKPIGIWVRQFSGYIDIRFYGVTGGGGSDDTAKIQKAIDYASISINSAHNFACDRSNTVYLPNGTYLISQLTIKSGVRMKGASMLYTIINSIDDTKFALIVMQQTGPTRDVHFSDMTFYGNADSYNGSSYTKRKGCFSFIASSTSNGLWESSFKNLLITKFMGHSMYFEGSTVETPEGYLRTNQFITMEAVQVESVGNLIKNYPSFYNNYHALELKGLNGQFAFNNCRFDGAPWIGMVGNQHKVNGIAVYIGTTTININPAMINFNNCTIQTAETGMYVESSHNISMIGCWFESLERAVVVRGQYRTSKSINIVNSLFSNAAGKYGNTGIYDGRIVSARNTNINFQNNYVLDSAESQHNDKSLLIAYDDIDTLTPAPNLGVTSFGNYFEKYGDSTKNRDINFAPGIKKDIVLKPGFPTLIYAEGAKAIYLRNQSGSTFTVDEISSATTAGEIIFIRAEEGSIKFKETKNIYLGNMIDPGTSTHGELTLNVGGVALFIKIDETVVVGPTTVQKQTYNLISYKLKQ